MTDENSLVKEFGGVRIFRGDQTKQRDESGHKADPEKWYYEPRDYDGDALWSKGFGSDTEAYHASGASTDAD